MNSRKPTFVSNARRPDPVPRLLSAAALGSAVFAPLQVESSHFGVLIVARRSVNAFAEALFVLPSRAISRSCGSRNRIALVGVTARSIT